MQAFTTSMHITILFSLDMTQLTEKTIQMPQAWHYTTTSTALSDGKTAQNTAKKKAMSLR